MVIRRFREADLERLIEITKAAFDGVAIAQNIEKHFNEVVGVPWQVKKGDDVRADAQACPEGIFVAEEEGEVIGYITTRLEREYRTGRIMNFAVLPGHQGQGIGKKLMKRALDFFREEGMSFARIETLEQNEVGKRFYPQVGFEEVARQIHYALKL